MLRDMLMRVFLGDDCRLYLFLYSSEMSQKPVYLEKISVGSVNFSMIKD